MSFIRPEAQTLLWRWREVLFGAALSALGLAAGIGPGGLLGMIGWVVAAVGAGLALTGYQRARFRSRPTGGPGAVDVDEGQVIYFGPLTGGAMALREMSELALIRARQSPHWRLSGGADVLFIPVDAEGADALFDAFTTLPGLRVERLLSALETEVDSDIVIWTRDRRDPQLPVH